MSDETQEQKEARTALEEAIDKCAKAYGEEGFLMEWMVVTAHHYSADDGCSMTGIDWYVSDDMPFYRIQGMLSYTMDRVRDTIKTHFEEP